MSRIIKLYAVNALILIIPLGASYKSIEARQNEYLSAKPGDPGFPYFGYNTIIESEEVFGPIVENTKTYSGSCHFEVFKFQAYMEFSIQIYFQGMFRHGFDKMYHSVPAGIFYVDYTINFPQNFVAKEPTKIIFYCDAPSGGFAYGNYSFRTIPTKPKIEDYIDNDLILDNCCFQLGKIEHINERYRFFFPKNGYFLNDQYYRLNLDFLYFRYEGDYYKNGNFKLTFNDVNNLFPNITNTANEKTIPLLHVFKDNIVRFIFKGPLYVEPNTLTMAFEEKPGYQKTNYFYLPKNKQNLFNGYEFTLHLEDLGGARLNFSYFLKFEVGYLLFGDCINSDYCLSGNVYD